MKVSRRDVLSASVLSFIAGGAKALGAIPEKSTKSQSATSASSRLLDALGKNRLPLTMNNDPSGPGWDWLVKEASGARFTLVGEDHGVAETAHFAAALFRELHKSGYSRMAVELSPPIAEDVETAAKRDGYDGVVGFLKNPNTLTFYNLKEEAQFLADVVGTVHADERVLCGLDREIFSDRYLISKLDAKAPDAAKNAVARLKEESAKAWRRFQQTQNPDDMFILSGDPELVSVVRAAWPKPEREIDQILRSLEDSLAIETAERTGGLWPYMQRRTECTRANFAALVNDGAGRGDTTKILMKFGYDHMIRGSNYVSAFDIGTMANEVAALTGDRAFHILVLPSPGSSQAVLGKGRSFRSVSTDEFDDFGAGDGRLTRVLPNQNATGHEVIDLRSLRPLAMRGLEGWNADVVRTIHGYDAAVIWKGAHASTGLE